MSSTFLAVVMYLVFKFVLILLTSDSDEDF